VKHLAIAPADAKHLRVTGLDPVLAGCLGEVPRLLAQGDRPPARHRLYPDPFRADAPANEEWHRLMDADLRHLFASAGEILERDLARLEPDPAQKSCSCLLLPVAHVNAWLSAVNQARLILAEQFGVTEAEMTREDLDPRRDQDLALFKIHVLGYLLQLLVDHAAT
jgi:hypothetical protein